MEDLKNSEPSVPEAVLGSEDDGVKGNETEEQPKKMQKTNGLFGMFSSIATGLTTASQTMVESAKEITKTVQKTIEQTPIMADFNKMQQDFICTKESQKLSPGRLPWEDAKNPSLARNQILSLSNDKRNFLREPPAGADFQYDSKTTMPIAALLLLEDQLLDKMRFELVPKQLTEEQFWRNYFYRVWLVQQSLNLSDVSASEDSAKGDITRDDVSVASNLDLMDGSVVGDSDAHHETKPSDESTVTSPTELTRDDGDKGSGKGSDDGWEQELQQTLDSYELVGEQDEAALGDNDLDLEQAADAVDQE